jgi:hypothetical protein
LETVAPRRFTFVGSVAIYGDTDEGTPVFGFTAVADAEGTPT